MIKSLPLLLLVGAGLIAEAAPIQRLTEAEKAKINEAFRQLEAKSQISIAVPRGEAVTAQPGRKVRLLLRFHNGSDEAVKFGLDMLKILRDAPGGGKALELSPLFADPELHLQQRLSAKKALLVRLEQLKAEELPSFLLSHFPHIPLAERSRAKAKASLENERETCFSDLKTLSLWRSSGSIPAHATLELAFKSRLPEGLDQDQPECQLTLRVQSPSGFLTNFPATALVE